MATDSKLTEAWILYYENNYSWDDAETHGGDDYVPYKKECKRLYKEVKSSHGKTMADRMHEWACFAYERMYYERGPSKRRLIADLPYIIGQKEVAEKALGWTETKHHSPLSVHEVAELLWHWHNTHTKTAIKDPNRPYAPRLLKLGLLRECEEKSRLSYRTSLKGDKMVEALFEQTRVAYTVVRTE